MNKKKRNRIFFNSVATVVIIVLSIIVNISIHNEQKKKLTLISDGASYCYGVDSLEKEGSLLTLKGWFVELKSIRKNELTTSDADAELRLALVPLDEAHINARPQNAIFFDVIKMKEDRPDVNEYLKCEYDYSKCEYTATVDIRELNLETTNYRLVIKPDATKAIGILLSVYLTDKGLMYTDPVISPELDTAGTELDRIVKEGVRLVSRPDYGCYVYQFGKQLYWIADQNYVFSENGATYIQYQLETTQVDNLPSERLENNWFWSNIGDLFERHEITGQIDCGKYRVSVRDIPKDYSVTNVLTGYHDGENWIWQEQFKLDYQMLK